MNKIGAPGRGWVALGVVSASLLAACDTSRPTASSPMAQSPVFNMGSAPGKPTRLPFPNTPFSVPAGVFCSFPVSVTIVENNEVSNTYPPDANGDVLQRITGKLVLGITNGTTNKSINVNVSGPGTNVFHADGSDSFTGYGRSIFFFSSNTIPAGPATFIYSGKSEATITASGQLTLDSQTGHAEDVCAELS
jgi:hypothetical protein